MAKYDNSFKKNIAEMVHERIKTKVEIQKKYGIAPSAVAAGVVSRFRDFRVVTVSSAIAGADGRCGVLVDARGRGAGDAAGSPDRVTGRQTENRGGL